MNISTLFSKAGSYCLEGATKLSPCPDGKTTRGSGATSVNNCTACEGGSMCRAGVKTACWAGTYSSEGSSSCYPCPQGFYCTAGSKAPIACPANTTSAGGTASLDKCFNWSELT